MNTNGIAQLFGVSPSTVKRWVKQLGLKLEKNEFGHYIYTEDDIKRLTSFKDVVHLETPRRNLTVNGKTLRKGIVMIRSKDKKFDRLYTKVLDMENRLERKADSSVTYQLLNHRSELEDLQNQIKQLTERIQKLEENNVPVQNPKIMEKLEQPKRKKKRLVTSLFGF